LLCAVDYAGHRAAFCSLTLLQEDEAAITELARVFDVAQQRHSLRSYAGICVVQREDWWGDDDASAWIVKSSTPHFSSQLSFGRKHQWAVKEHCGYEKVQYDIYRSNAFLWDMHEHRIQSRNIIVVK
jgi:hypothetical protein